MMRKSILLFVYLLLAGGGMLYAQTSQDAGLWASYAFEAKYKKKWTFGISPEVRFNNNMTHLNRAMIDIGAEYKPIKTFFAGASYRTSLRSQDDWQDVRERFQFGIGLRQEWNAFTFTYQPRYQVALQQVGNDGDADFETTFRNKLTVKYDINKKTDVSTAFEVFNNAEQGQEFTLENWRWKVDFSYAINKRNEVSIGYMIQKSIYDSPQEMDYVVIIGYSNDINLSKKKSKESKPAVTPPSGE
jgi:hypothetical protein